jgi:hypothetical protein
VPAGGKAPSVPPGVVILVWWHQFCAEAFISAFRPK